MENSLIQTIFWIDLLRTFDRNLLRSLIQLNKYHKEVVAEILLEKTWGQSIKKWKPAISYYKWYQQIKFFKVNQKSVNLATIMNKKDLVLFYLEETSLKPSQTVVNRICRSVSLDLLKNLAEKQILPNVEGANFASEANQLEVLKWLTLYNIYPDRISSRVLEKGYWKIVEWILDNTEIKLTTIDMNIAARSGHIVILLMGQKFGLYPNNFFHIITWNQLEVLKWLDFNKVLDWELIRSGLNYYLDSIKWHLYIKTEIWIFLWEQIGYLPSPEIQYQAIKKKKFELIKFLIRLDYKFTRRLIEISLIEGDYMVSDWIKNNLPISDD